MLLKIDKETKKDEEVKELESLKKIFSTPSPPGKHISVGKMSSSVFSNVNGHKTSHSEIKEQISKNGKLFAKVSGKADFRQENDGEPQSKSKVDVDIPSKGIHRTILKDGGNVEVVDGQDFSNNGQRRSSIDNGINKISSYAGLDYTPLDMAEYIFWTGDEKGVIMAIQEFLEEGIMSRDEAINCLQSIKTNLEYMEKHYHGLQKTENRLNNGRSHIHDSLAELEKPSSLDYDSLQENERMTNEIYDDSVSKYETSMMKPDAYDRRAKIQLGGDEGPLRMKSFGQGTFTDRAKRYREDVKGNGVTLTEDDFEELLERLRVADFLYNEYSLEEVIYQLAKVVFSQSLARGSSDAQIALQRFISFLEKEARLGQISRGLEKKIIDLLIAALSDTLAEHPQLLSAVKENLNDVEVPNLSSSMIMKNQLEKNSKESSFMGNLGKTTSKASPSLQNKAETSKN